MDIKNLKPFNLEAALKGEPVKLRSGRKAFVRHHETEVMVMGGGKQLWGVITENPSLLAWTKDGCYDMDGDVSCYDNIGMYPKTRIINGFEVPETGEPEQGSEYFIARPSFEDFYERYVWHNDVIDKRHMERGLVFLTKEDAIANSKAMLGIDPYGED